MQDAIHPRAGELPRTYRHPRHLWVFDLPAMECEIWLARFRSDARAWAARKAGNGYEPSWRVHAIVWQAEPAGGGWLPWVPVAGHIEHPAALPLSLKEAHAMARKWRPLFPGSLVAVRPRNAGPPVYPDAMHDAYDLPPYADGY